MVPYRGRASGSRLRDLVGTWTTENILALAGLVGTVVQLLYAPSGAMVKSIAYASAFLTIVLLYYIQVVFSRWRAYVMAVQVVDSVVMERVARRLGECRADISASPPYVLGYAGKHPVNSLLHKSLDDIAEVVRELAGQSSVFVSALIEDLDKEGARRLRVGMWATPNDECTRVWRARRRKMRLPVKRSLAGKVFVDGASICVGDMRLVHDHEVLDEGGYPVPQSAVGLYARSVISVPVLSASTSVRSGVLTVYCPEPNRLRPEHIPVIRLAARALTMVLDCAAAATGSNEVPVSAA